MWIFVCVHVCARVCAAPCVLCPPKGVAAPEAGVRVSKDIEIGERMTMQADIGPGRDAATKTRVSALASSRTNMTAFLDMHACAHLYRR